MKNIFLLVGLTIAFASIVYSQTTSEPPRFTGAKLCQIMSSLKPAAAEAIYQKFLQAVKDHPESTKLLPNTIAYIEGQKVAILKGGEPCTTAFADIKGPLDTDLKPLSNTQKQQIGQYLQHLVA